LFGSIKTRNFTRLTANTYSSYYTDKKNRVHAIHSKGMLIYQNQRLYPVGQFYPELRPYAGYSINSHIDYNDSLEILGTEKIVWILLWDYKNRAVKNINSSSHPISLAADIVNMVFKDTKKMCGFFLIK
jgi:hypothetical protein